MGYHAIIDHHLQHLIFSVRQCCQLQTFVRFDTVIAGFEKVEENLREYLQIKEAARVLGVSEGTIRNWGKQGKLRMYRHPINRYRLFKKADLEALLCAIRRSAESV
jgi:DNA (cytosine-5)-methyltransferase 1